MNNKDLIKQYVGSTGLSIPEYQFNKLNNNLKNSYLRKRIQATEASPREYLRYFELIALPEDVRTKYINKLNSFGIDDLLNYSKERDKIINILLSTEGFINKLNSYGIYYLFIYSNEPDKIINILLSTKGFINNLDSYGIKYLLEYSNEPDKIKAILTKYGKI